MTSRPTSHQGFIQARLLTLSVCSETSVFIRVSTMVGGTHGFTTVSRGTSNLCTTRTSETRPGTHAGRPTGDIHPPERPRVAALAPLVGPFGVCLPRVGLGPGAAFLFAEERE